MGNLLEDLLKESRAQLELEQETDVRQTELVTHLASQEISRLKEQNAELVRLVEIERTSSQKSRDGLIKQISSLLVDFTEERDRELRELTSGVQQNNASMMDVMGSLHEEYAAIGFDASDRRKNWGNHLEGKSVDSTSTREVVSKVRRYSSFRNILTDNTAVKALLAASTSVEDGLSNLRSSTMSSIERHSKSIIQIAETLNSCNKGMRGLAFI